MRAGTHKKLKQCGKRVRAAILATAAMALAIAALAPQAARAQGSRKDDVVFNAQGHPMAGATVRVCSASATGQPCTPLANIYSDAALTQALANPLATDGLGNYTFYAAPGRYEIEISGPNITTKQMSNVILPNDPSAPAFTTVSTTGGITAFSLSLSGNLTVNGSTAVTGTLTEGGAPVATTTPTFITANTESGLPNSRQLVNGANTTVDTSIPGQIAINASGSGGSGGGTGYSVSSYGARSLNPFVGYATGATCTASSTSVTLGSALQFQNNDGIFLPGCGAATTLTTPGAPTVTPVALAGPENSGVYVALSGQSTSYAYEISAEDLGNGHTAASPSGATANGDATLGLHTATISSCSLSGIVVTCTLTTSPTDLPAGAYIHIMGINPAQFDAWATLYSISGNTITFEQPENSNYAGVATSATGGTLAWHVANLIALPSGTTAQDFIVYGRASGSLNYLCISGHNTANGYSQLWFMDYGATESGHCSQPAWIPSSPPSSALADGLVTTVAAGGGTNSITLASAAASSSGTNGATAQYDNCAQVQAAANAAAANSGSGVLYFPPGVWVISSYCQLPAGITVNQAGTIETFNTIDITGPTRWYADRYNSGSGSPSFAIAGFGPQPINVESPYPGLFGNGPRFAGSTSVGMLFEGLVVTSRLGANLQQLAVLDDMSSFRIDSSVFSTTSNGGDTDFLGTALTIRSAYNSFDNNITNSTFTDGMAQFDQDDSWAPTVLIRGYTGDFHAFDNINTGTRGGIGWVAETGFQGIAIPLSNVHAQGPEVPLFWTNGTYGWAQFTNDLIDSSAGSAIFVSTGTWILGDVDGYSYFSGQVTLTNSQQPSADTYGYPGAISGIPVESLDVHSQGNNPGQNFSFEYSPQIALLDSNGFSTGQAALSSANQPNGPTVVPYGTFAPFAFAQTISAPSASVSSGGSVPVGTGCYYIAWVYPSGGVGALSPCQSVTTTSGNQTVTLTPPTAPAGVAGWEYYRDIPTSGGSPRQVTCTPVGGTCVDTANYTVSSNAPTASADGYPHFGVDGLRTPQVTTNALTGALVTKSSAYTLTSSDYWVNVTGTTTITVPHATVGQHWVVFNSGSATVTLKADSGNLNGAASITLSANTGKEIACDGTNCFAH